MRVAVVTAGTLGDILPYVALTQALVARGHDAYLVIPDGFAATAAAYGVPVRPYGDIPPEHLDAIVRQLIGERNYFKHPGIVAHAHAVPNVRAIGKATFAATRDADVIVSHSLAFMGIIAAEINRKPLVIAHLFPNLIASANMTPDGSDFGRPLNALGWLAGRAIVRHSADPALAELFRTFGLVPRRDAMLSTGGRGVLNLVAVSPAVLAPDARWPASYHRTGYWFPDEPAFAPDEALLDFCARDEAPVVVAFGSVGHVDGAALVRTAIEALARLGCRAIVQTETPLDESLPPGIVNVGAVPHRWLFARARCVITHGGAGTIAAALRAGVTPVTVYHYGDQRLWGMQLARLGVAPRPLSRRAFDGFALGRRLHRTLNDAPMRERVRTIGERVRAENGVAEAVTLIEGVVPG